MHRSLLNLQSYVPRIGDAVFPPPFSIDGMDMLVFVLATDPKKVDKLLDRELNDPWQEAFALRGLKHHYKSAAGWIAVVISEADEVYPSTSASARKPNGNNSPAGVGQAGDGPEGAAAKLSVSAHQRELIVMVPVRDLGANPDFDAPASGLSGLWYVPLVLNDLPPAVAAGREIFGYPKIYATFENKEDQPGAKEKPLLEENGPTWETLRIKAYGPVKRTDDERKQGRILGTHKLDLDEVLRVSIDANPAPPDSDSTDPFATEASALFDEQIQLLFLRQFLDPQFPQRASYQAVVSGTVTAGLGDSNADQPEPDPRPRRFTLQFHESAIGVPSIADALGIETANDGRVTPRAVFALRDRNLLVPRGEVKWDKS